MTDTSRPSAGIEPTRVSHCRHDDVDIYVGRGDQGDADMLNTPVGERGWLGNPFTVNQWGRGPAISNYQRVFEWRLDADSEFRQAVKNLAGETLGCWCQRLDDDGPGCHAEVIAQKADQLAGSRGPETDGGTVRDGTERREGSRLEIDDPKFCKVCGTRLPDMCVEEGWHPLGGDEPPEFCGSCLAEVMLG